MGINDRDYAREEQQGFNLGGIQWSGVGIVIALNVVVYIIDMLTTEQILIRDHLVPVSRIQQYAALKPDLFQHPLNFWQLFTYGWLHSQQTLMHIVFNMFGLWFFGKYSENVMGRTRFLQFYISSIILAGLGWVISQQAWFPLASPGPPVVGASGAIMAVIAFVAWNSPNLTVLIYGLLPMPMWLMGILYLFMDISGYMRGRDHVAYTAHIAGALAGTLFYHTRWCLADLLPNGLISKFTRSVKIRRSNLKVHRPSDDKDDEYDSRPEPSMTARMDAILEKISRVGRDGLTQAERDFMDKAADRLRARKGK